MFFHIYPSSDFKREVMFMYVTWELLLEFCKFILELLTFVFLVIKIIYHFINKNK